LSAIAGWYAFYFTIFLKMHKDKVSYFFESKKKNNTDFLHCMKYITIYPGQTPDLSRLNFKFIEDKL